MRMMPRPVFGLASLLLAGCLQIPTGTPDKSLSTGYDIGNLPGQRMETGQCGLFLFTPLPKARFVFFAEWEKNRALIQLDGKIIKLSGPIPVRENQDSHLVRQGFASANSEIQIEISVTPETGNLTDGARISSGLIRIYNQEGWVQLVPVAGAFACAAS